MRKKALFLVTKADQTSVLIRFDSKIGNCKIILSCIVLILFYRPVTGANKAGTGLTDAASFVITETRTAISHGTAEVAAQTG